jgi:hypothetical protein
MERTLIDERMQGYFGSSFRRKPESSSLALVEKLDPACAGMTAYAERAGRASHRLRRMRLAEQDQFKRAIAVASSCADRGCRGT